MKSLTNFAGRGGRGAPPGEVNRKVSAKCAESLRNFGLIRSQRAANFPSFFTYGAYYLLREQTNETNQQKT